MTEKLYYKDTYLQEFTATVTQLRREQGKTALILDRTAFYPEGGGQPADHGRLFLSDGTVLTVCDVQEKEGEILHVIRPEQAAEAAAAALSAPGGKLKGVIDWERRFDHMQQHSGEHIVSGMICRRFHCDNVGFHLGEDLVTIDFNTRISMEDAESVENMANAYIWEDHPFEVLWPSPKERETLDYRSKKELEGEVRITCFPGADMCACCGTHVSGSAQIGLVKFLSARNFHEGTRLELVCGSRAVRLLSMNYRVNKETAVLLSTKEANASSHVEKLLKENIRLKASCAAMEEQYLQKVAASYEGQGNVLVIDEPLTVEQIRPLADKIADLCGAMAAVFAADGDRYRYAVISRDADIAEWIREMNQALHGRGGGRNGFAQGSVEADREQIREFFDRMWSID